MKSSLIEFIHDMETSGIDNAVFFETLHTRAYRELERQDRLTIAYDGSAVQQGFNPGQGHLVKPLHRHFTPVVQASAPLPVTYRAAEDNAVTERVSKLDEGDTAPLLLSSQLPYLARDHDAPPTELGTSLHAVKIRFPKLQLFTDLYEDNTRYQRGPGEHVTPHEIQADTIYERIQEKPLAE